MKIKHYLSLFAVLSSILLLAACGSNSGSGGDKTAVVEPEEAALVGITNCAQCHAQINEEWLESGHGNANSSPTGPHAADSYCGSCHNNLDDGSLMNDAYDLALRDVVGCESCHGGGSQHRGLGPLPYPSPSYEQCATCHNDEFPHVEHYPFADNITENYTSSAHFHSINEHVQEAEGEAVRARCAMCHTDEGFRDLAATYSGLGHDELVETLENNPEYFEVSQIECRTCHDVHTGELRASSTNMTVEDTKDSDGADLDEAEELDLTAYSAQFNLCTSCHQVFLSETFDEVNNTFDYTLDSDVYSDPTLVEYHNPAINQYGALGEIISDTHFAGVDAAGNDVVGYNINAADENACLNCHDAHGATKFEQGFAVGISEEWGNEEGFHGDYASRAFSYPQEPDCALCHSGTEFVKYTEGLDIEDLDEGEARVVACVSCHDLQYMNESEEFELGHTRSIAEFVFPNEMAKASADEAYEPKATAGLGDNALCMTCHSGRTGQASLDAAIAESDADGDGAADDGDFGGYGGFVNVHYKIAGATQYGTLANGGYQFEGKAYASKFEHVEANDSCIECHSAHDGSIYFSDPGHGGLVGCDNCHTNSAGAPVATAEGLRDIRMIASQADYDGDGNATEGIYYEIEGLKELLAAALTNAGVNDIGGYPYFDSITTVEEFKAAYNLHFVREDPGAYAHNPAYAIQLLYDSLEALGEDVSGLTRDDEGHFDASAEAFRHWDEDGGVSTSCAACHSSDGAQAFLANGEVLEEDLAPDTNGISSGLACETCHAGTEEDPFDGSLRTLTSVTFPSGVVLDDTNAGASFADGSPICMTCHQGRNSKADVDADIAAGDFGFVNIHYYPAAASVFGSLTEGGYQYDGNSYAGPTEWPAFHVGADFNTCAGCHLDGAPSHDFKPALSNCTGCHGGTSFETLGYGVADNYDDIQTLSGELLVLIEASGVTKLDGYPYFEGITTAAQMKASYNYQVTAKEPCGYIHNATYIKQLLYDSIEDMGGTPSVARP